MSCEDFDFSVQNLLRALLDAGFLQILIWDEAKNTPKKLDI